MSIPVVCAKCSAKLNAPDSAAGKRVKCPKCQTAMVVPDFLSAVVEEPEFEVVEDTPPAKKKPPIKPKVVAKVDVEIDDEEEDDRPRSKKRRPADDDDDDRPRKKKRKRDDDYDDDEKSGVSMTRNIIMGVVLLILLGVAAWVFYDRSQKKDANNGIPAPPNSGAASSRIGPTARLIPIVVIRPSVYDNHTRHLLTLKERAMFRRSLVVLIVCIAILPACKKKKTDNGGGTEPGPGPVPSAVSSDFVAFVHFKAKDIRDNPLFDEVKAAVAKAGATAEWDKAEAEALSQIGVKPSDIDSVTVFVTDVPKGNMPKLVGIMTTGKPIDKTKLGFLGKQVRPDARGLYALQGGPVGGYIHFPDDKTIAFVSTDLGQKYLDGYAKNRTGWPMTAELSRAAAGHTLYAVIQFDKIPSEMTNGITRDSGLNDLAPALTARRITLNADLKGKELSMGVRVGFPDAAAAGKAKDAVHKFLGMALGHVDNVLAGKGPPELSGFMPAVQEAQRALKDAKVTVSGSDLTVSGSFKANFDVGAMVAEAVKEIQGSADAMKEQNNLKQIGLALINYSDTNRGLAPIHAVGATGLPLKTANEKPLLSWRVAILPYIEQVELYKKFKLDEPWDGPNNKKLIELMPKIYTPLKPGKPGYTHLQMVIGPNALQPVGTKYPASFPDGTSNTISVVEAAEPVIWTKPDDLMMPGNQWPRDFRKKFGGLKPGGFYAVLWDGSVRFIRDSVSDQTLGFALNPRDGQVLGKDW